jgi:hypothetical protein
MARNNPGRRLKRSGPTSFHSELETIRGASDLYDLTRFLIQKIIAKPGPVATGVYASNRVLPFTHDVLRVFASSKLKMPFDYRSVESTAELTALSSTWYSPGSDCLRVCSGRGESKFSPIMVMWLLNNFQPRKFASLTIHIDDQQTAIVGFGEH